jgi:hypothetical protein
MPISTPQAATEFERFPRRWRADLVAAGEDFCAQTARLFNPIKTGIAVTAKQTTMADIL